MITDQRMIGVAGRRMLSVEWVPAFSKQLKHDSKQMLLVLGSRRIVDSQSGFF